MGDRREISIYATDAVVAAVDAHQERCSTLGLQVGRSKASEALCRLGRGKCEPQHFGRVGKNRLAMYAAPDVRAAIADTVEARECSVSDAACALILAGACSLEGAS